MSEAITQIPLDDLHESPFNQRKVFDEAGMQQLAADIKAQGRVLQPLLVRPIVPPLFKGDEHGQCGYEIVFGHRRFRAAGLAGMASAPCMVRAMEDAEARRAQTSENLAREDVHPIEEAEGFQTLIDNDNMTADLIAEQFGKSRSYVYGRLKLLEACSVIRQACLAGEIDAEVALLVARLRTTKLQEKALEYIKKEYRARLDDGGKASFRTIRALLNEKFTLDLKSAMFDVDDEMLLPSAGYCGRCPKKSGNAPEFIDVAEPDARKDKHGMRRDGVRNEGPDVCTDPDCFDAKKKAHLKREADKLTAAGKVVVAGNAARAAISAHGEIKGAYIALSEVRAGLKKLPKKGSAAAQDAAQPEIFTIQDPRTGKTHHAVKREAVVAAGVDVKSAKPKFNSYEEDRKRRETEAASKTAANVRLFHQVRAAMAGCTPDLEDLRAVAAALVELMGHSEDDQVLFTTWEVANEHALAKLVQTMPVGDLQRLVMDCVLVSGVTCGSYYNSRDEGPAHLLATAARCGIDVDAARAEPAEGASTPSPAARAPEEAKAAPAGADAWDGAFPKLKSKGKEPEQKDDAGLAGGRGAQADAFDEEAAA